MDTTPELLKPNFKCLHCQIVTQHEWRNLESKSIARNKMGGIKHYTGFSDLEVFKISICYNCRGIAMWQNETIISPNTSHQPSAHPDMLEHIKPIYEEAASISRASSRASCALMRYALEELIKSMGYKDGLYNDIGKMYQEGLIDDNIKDSLDIVRLTGNDALHSNQIDMDDQTNVDYMFELINEIVESLISSPKRRKSMLEKFGQNPLDSIKKRDSK